MCIHPALGERPILTGVLCLLLRTEHREHHKAVKSSSASWPCYPTYIPHGPDLVLCASAGVWAEERDYMLEPSLGRQEFSGSVPASILLDHTASCPATAAGDRRDCQAGSCRGEKVIPRHSCAFSLCQKFWPMLCDFQLLIRKFSRTCNGVSRWYVYTG